MRGWLFSCFFLFSLCVMAQDSTVFVIKKAGEGLAMEKPLMDTFIQRTFLTSQTEKKNRIIYRTGFKLLDEKMLIYFSATQSIIDSLKSLEDKNATTGNWRKVPYSLVNDTLSFVLEETVSSRRYPQSRIHIKHGYSGPVNGNKIPMIVYTSSDNAAEAPPFKDAILYELYTTSLLIRKRGTH
ncbi:MAG: hypothetical protein U0V74_10085 [Chitinophagales bacterium]